MINIQKKIYTLFLYGMTIHGVNNNNLQLDRQYVEINSQLEPLSTIKEVTMNMILQEKNPKEIIEAIHILSHFSSLEIKKFSKENMEKFYNAFMALENYGFLMWLVDGSMYTTSAIVSLFFVLKTLVSTIEKDKQLYPNLYNYFNNNNSLFTNIENIYKLTIMVEWDHKSNLSQKETDLFRKFNINILLDMLYNIINQWVVRTLLTSYNKYLNPKNIMWNNLAHVILITIVNIFKIYIPIPRDMMLISFGGQFVNIFMINVFDLVRFNKNKKRIEEKFNHIQYIEFVYNPKNKTLYVAKGEKDMIQMTVMNIMLNK